MQKTSQVTRDTPWYGRGCRWLLRLACGALLGVATYRALALLPSPLTEFQHLGFVDALPVSPAVVHLGTAALAAVLYALLPPLGGVVALVSLLLPMAFLHVGLAGVYAVLALLCLPCLAKHAGVLVLVLIPLALAYPAFALVLPLVPVLAGLLSGRFLGPYTAAVAALVLVVLGLVAGRATVGEVTIGGDRDPLMASEEMVFVTENMPLMPSLMNEHPDFVRGFREAVREGNGGSIIAWFYIMLQYWVPACLAGAIFALAELGPRLLAAHLVGLIALWAVMAGAVAWGTWWVKRVTYKESPRRVGQ
jgi:hypothetical protein